MKDIQKKISVIIPCYNVERWIDRCIVSIIGQTFGIDDLEIICIDDASTDATWAHLQKWERSYPNNILLVRQIVNRRPGAARNLGLRYASADYIAFVDADDWVEPDYLECLYRAVIKYDCDIALCGWIADMSRSLIYFSKEQRDEKEDVYYIVDTVRSKKGSLRRKDIALATGQLMRKKMIEDHKLFYPEDLCFEDTWWHPLICIYAQKLYLVKKRLYHYFVNPDSVCNHKNVDHYIDLFTIQMIKWTDYEKRGLFVEYRDELEYDALENAAGFLNAVIFRYDEPSFSYYQLEKAFIQQHIPDYRNNPYIRDCTETTLFLLEMLYMPLNKKEFHQIVKEMKVQTSRV